MQNVNSRRQAIDSVWNTWIKQDDDEWLTTQLSLENADSLAAIADTLERIAGTLEVIAGSTL